MQIAKNGIGATRPNPSVGAVVVWDGRIIGEGFTSNYGGPHAEVNAIASVKDKALLKEATIYVTLEPCAHVGKTPACADLIVKSQLKNIVIGCVDPNSLVAGKGIEHLEESGCNVTVGVLEKECLAHHKRFFTVQNKKRPYILLKWAETQDGFISPDLSALSKKVKAPIWISNTYSQQLVHKWRSEEQAILVGTTTVIADNPKLNVRSWAGNHPTRVVLDCSLRIPETAQVFDGSVSTIVLTASAESESRKKRVKKVIFEQIDFSKNVAEQVCEVLCKHNVQSVLVEGGTQTLQTFIDADLWDEARVFTGAIAFGSGVKSPRFTGDLKMTKSIQKDVLKIYVND